MKPNPFLKNSWLNDLAAQQVCRDCGKVLDGVTSLNGSRKPPKGSVSICAYCACIAIFDDESLLREPTDAEMDMLRASKEWRLIERTVRLIKQSGGGFTMKSLYEELGVSQSATAEEIKTAYRKASKRTHPDVGGDADGFRRVSLAYEVLSDPARRERYDATGEDGTESGPTARDVIVSVWDQVLETFSPGDDLLKLLQHGLDGALRTIDGNIRDLSKREKKFAEMMSRLCDDGGLFRGVIEAKVAGLKQRIEFEQRGRKLVDSAKALVTGVSYRADSRYEAGPRPFRRSEMSASESELFEMIMKMAGGSRL
jgi:curved DNA-binding protein CbpA